MSLSIHCENLKQFSSEKEHDYFAKPFLEKKLEEFTSTINLPDCGFFNLTNSDQYIKECQETLSFFKNKKNLVHVGIGGSSLGPKMLLSALQKNHERKVIFINNIDPDEIFDQLQNLDFNTTLFYFVSKSGGTAETMASLAIITQLLLSKGVAEKELKNYFLFATDPIKSELKDLAIKQGIMTLPVPPNVGGRFSVLSPVGLFTAHFVSIDIIELLEGANAVKKSILETNVYKNPLLKTASWVMYFKDRGHNQTVLMPYSSKLKDLSSWFTQLWAESLGKKCNKSSDKVFEGLTPIPAYGATDQHSQMQLFMEGPFDKLLFIVEVEKFHHDFSLDSIWDASALLKLKNYQLSELMKAELKGTERALDNAKRPFVNFTIDKVDEHSMGELIMFFESLTVLMGHYLNIDPFDQPGVEAGKIHAYEYLQK